jgi:hypothetical protein
LSTNFEKLHQAGIVGVPHAITADDEDAINSLSDSEVDALISVKSKLSAPSAESVSAAAGPPRPVGTMSF